MRWKKSSRYGELMAAFRPVAARKLLLLLPLLFACIKCIAWSLRVRVRVRPGDRCRRRTLAFVRIYEHEYYASAGSASPIN
jgi:hypothetical protein